MAEEEDIYLTPTLNVSSWENSVPEQLHHPQISGLKIRTTEAEVHSTPEEEEQDDENGVLSPLENNSPTQTLICEINSDSSDQPTEGTPQTAGSARKPGASASTGISLEEGNSTAGTGQNRGASVAARKTPAGETGGGETPGSSGDIVMAKTPSIPIPGASRRGESRDGTTPNTASGASEQDNEIVPAPITRVRTRPATANEIKVVIAGKSGAGKSELINKLLGTNKLIKLSPKSTTDKLEPQEISRDGITICIIDTPGLKTDPKEKRKQLKELSRFTGGSADLLVYCIPVAPSVKFSDANPSIIKALKDVFGAGVWDNCVVVFTFSNLAWNHIRPDHDQEHDAIVEYKAYTQIYAKEFEEELEKLKVPNIKVKTVFDLPSPPRANNDINMIPAVPAGFRVQDRVLVDLEMDHESWTDIVFLEMLEKCKGKHKMALLQYRYGKEQVSKAFKSQYGVVLMGSSGGGALIVGAATVGSIAGLGAGPVGMVLGGIIGAAVGIVASTVLSGGIAANISTVKP